MAAETYGHTPIERRFARRDVYGIGYDEARAARRPLRLGVCGTGGVAQSKHLPAINRLRTLWEPVTDWDGYRACALVDATHRSLETGEVVPLAPVGGE